MAAGFPAKKTRTIEDGPARFPESGLWIHRLRRPFSARGLDRVESVGLRCVAGFWWENSLLLRSDFRERRSAAPEGGGASMVFSNCVNAAYPIDWRLGVKTSWKNIRISYFSQPSIYLMIRPNIALGILTFQHWEEGWRKRNVYNCIEDILTSTLTHS